MVSFGSSLKMLLTEIKIQENNLVTIKKAGFFQMFV